MSDLVQEQIKVELAKFSDKHGPAAIVPATVLAINNDDTVHVQFSDDSEIDDVRLRSVVKAGDKVLLIPKVGSIVQVAKIENSDEYLIIAVEEITDVVYVIGGTRYEANNRGHLIEAQGETLLQIVLDLIDACKNERHLTKQGPTITMSTVSKTVFNSIKTRAQKLLRNA